MVLEQSLLLILCVSIHFVKILQRYSGSLLCLYRFNYHANIPKDSKLAATMKVFFQRLLAVFRKWCVEHYSAVSPETCQMVFSKFYTGVTPAACYEATILEYNLK
jgi:hypothetical protein